MLLICLYLWLLLHINSEMIGVYIYRLVTGLLLSFAIIFVIVKYEKALLPLAKLGKYSLVIYTSSLASLGLVAKVLNILNLHNNSYLQLDILSLLLCIVLIVVPVLLYSMCKKNRITSLLFLGE